MTDLWFFTAESLLLIVFVFFVAVKNDAKRGLIAGLIAVKGVILWVVVSKNFDLSPALWAYLIIFAAALGIITALSGPAAPWKGAKGFIVLCLAMIFLALFSAGCGKNSS